MITSAIRVLNTLLEGQMRVRDLAKAVGMSYRRTAEIVDGLLRQGFLERKDERVGLASTALATLFRKVSKRWDAVKLLGDSREEVLLLVLLKPSRIEDLQSSSRLSYRTIRRALVVLMETGAVREAEGRYSVVDNQGLQLFLTVLKEEKQRRTVEPYAEVVYASPGTILKRVPEGKSAKGSLTAFSVFSKYGVELRPVYAYYVQPEGELGAEEVLIHALIFSEGPVELTDCAVFYAKNRDVMDIGRVREIARRFGVGDTLANLEDYVRNLTVPASERFLPWDEFAERSKLYGVSPEDMLPPVAFPDLMDELSKRVERELRVYVLGGEAMRIRGLKRATKDVDMVVEDAKKYTMLKAALASMSYRALREEEFTRADKRITPSGIFVKEGFPRVDLFVGSICNAFSLSSSMKGRCELKEKGKLKFCLMSNEDIFLLKSVTGREGDIYDMILLASAQGFNWRIVFDELYGQERETGRHFCMDLLNSVEAVERRAGIRAPFYNKLVNHCIDYAVIESVRRLEVATLRQIRELVNYPDYRLRSRIKKLVREGKLADLGGGRFAISSPKC
ncbi:MAG: hypothetical protein FJZ49_08460 [Candidatus Verstraetearchaeota archaeon]|nr:hypothetical protein [Candidatus Verstraetearchaeota archaeon]